MDRLKVVTRDATVLRLKPWRASFEPGPPRAQPDDFVPSNDEKDDAKRTGEPVLVSVWREAETSLDQARAIYGNSTAVGFRLSVRHIEDVVVVEGHPRLQVLTDPYVNDERPGALGHCGIAGLERRSGEARPEWRNMLAVLAERAVAC